MPKFVISLPDSGELVRDLKESHLTVGRTEENTLQIDDISVSTHHAELTRRGAAYVLKDLDSTNGTYVNGEPLKGERMLRTGDRVQFGKIDAEYQSDAPARVHPLPQEASAPSMASSAANSQRPEDFGNVSPFRKKQVKANPMDAVCIGLFAVSVLVFLGLAVTLGAY